MSGEVLIQVTIKILMKLENVKHKKSLVPRVFKANLGGKEYICHFGIAWDRLCSRRGGGEVIKKNRRGLAEW